MNEDDDKWGRERTPFRRLRIKVDRKKKRRGGFKRNKRGQKGKASRAEVEKEIFPRPGTQKVENSQPVRT